MGGLMGRVCRKEWLVGEMSGFYCFNLMGLTCACFP